ncbi:2-oxo acid dehydrogenase subunit E2 [Gimesia fumaroli]|jgi:pyruvate dehydrogenase E2 component (dihydrolipoamide acetyltransferase)|uniref:Dihydrolipoamide acetyltransferase component of pyruvate dehydrogenase complex n=1 Tax=Gimesia fumaroli TaxID=2527976 RepID=A0A518IEU0_9PLAN|nr:2-oxo acid dehydrogenase subunit E2 [Gimesia fumaroli]QDV51604.1 Dihydrolipoyllysine-residue acetyltransferase component of pyruvate dehydrogenase complex [Gimesia fumaroli]
MATEFKLPEVSEGVETADVGQISVAVGDTVEEGQVLMDIETDKAVVQLESPYSGTIAALNVSEGDSVPIGAVLLSIEQSNGAPAAAAPETKPTEEPAAEETKAPETETAATPEPKPETAPAVAPAAKPAAAPAAGTSDKAPAPAGPATRKLARKLGVDLHQVGGSGPGGRITQEDVENFVKNLIAGGGTSGGGGGIAVPPLPDFSQFGEVERTKMKKLARVSANNLSLSWQVVPHVTQHDLADITDLETARKLFISKPNYSGPKVTMTALAMKAIAIALHEFPVFNSSLDTQTDEIVLKKFINIGVAVDTENGLVVPVVKDVDKKNIITIAQEMNTLAIKARDRKLEMSDMQGGTFTITNLGGLGGTSFTPIVNYPEVAILGMSRSRNEFQLVNDSPVPRLMLPLSLSYDHRVINGADAARFIVRLSSLLSDPFNLLVDC